MALVVRSIERRVGEELPSRRSGRRARPGGVPRPPRRDRRRRDRDAGGRVRLARTLRDALDPYTGVIVILLERKHDAWLAGWSGADAWFVKPVDPFELADRLLELVTERGAKNEKERV